MKYKVTADPGKGLFYIWDKDFNRLPHESPEDMVKLAMQLQRKLNAKKK